MPEPLPTLPDHTSRSPPVSPYPTMQAIATPRSWAHRGHWGLKRDLPIERSQKTSYMRYQDLDTINHMATFESSHDTVYTHRKWQEMDIPISKDIAFDTTNTSQRLGGDYDNRPSVFDSSDAPENYKWRYNGPYTNNMTNAEISAYIDKHVRPRRDEFLVFVAARLNYTKAFDELKKTNRYDITKEEIQALADTMPLVKPDLRTLRTDRITLEGMVGTFLDMPIQNQPYAVHPSAGLHYTRSSAHMVNDPVLGPQDKKPIVQGRELNFAGNQQLAGIAGIVAGVQRQTQHWSGATRGAQFDRMALHKYRPLKAHLDSRGTIMLEVEQVREGPQVEAQGYRGPANPVWGNVYPGGRPERPAWGTGQPEATDAVLGLLGRSPMGSRRINLRQ